MKSTDKDLIDTHNNKVTALLSELSDETIKTKRQTIIQISELLSNTEPFDPCCLTDKTIQALLTLLESDDEKTRECASHTVWKFTRITNELNTTFIQHHALPRLANLLTQESNLLIGENTSAAIANLASTSDTGRDEIISLNLLPLLTKLLQSKRTVVHRHACCALSNLALSSNSIQNKMVHSDVLPHLINLLEDEDADSKRFALNAIINLSSRADERRLTLIVCSAMPCLLALLEDSLLKESAIQAISIIVSGSIKYKSEQLMCTFIESNALPKILMLLKQNKLLQVQDKVTVPFNLASFNQLLFLLNATLQEPLKSGLSDELLGLYKIIQQELCMLYCNLTAIIVSYSLSEYFQSNYLFDIIPYLVSLLKSDQLLTVRYAVDALSNLALINQPLAEAIYKNDALPHIVPLLKSSDNLTKFGASRTLASLSFGTVEIKEAMLACDPIPSLKFLLNDKDHSISVFATVSLFNLSKRPAKANIQKGQQHRFFNTNTQDLPIEEEAPQNKRPYNMM
jgi:hypothetical protein